jgi:hypothetical protein
VEPGCYFYKNIVLIFTSRRIKPGEFVEKRVKPGLGIGIALGKKPQPQ